MGSTRAVIHLDNLRNNIRLIKNCIKPGVRICASVKADAYGHGAIEVSRTALQEGVSYLSVATLEEVFALRQEGFTCPILLLTSPLPEEFPYLIENDISLLVGEAGMARNLDQTARRIGKKALIHLDIDTGMGRIGCFPKDTVSLAKAIVSGENLVLEGTATHFSEPENSDFSFTEEQIFRFEESLAALRKEGIDPGIVHASNSGAIFQHPKAHYDMVRPGILLYGYFPSPDMEHSLPLRPVMELESQIVMIKDVEKGTPISYGRTFITPAKRKIGTINTGYGDGYNRLLSNKGNILINGRLFPVAGRVCMDQFMVDLGESADIAPYDRAVLFGPDARGPSAWDIALAIGTIPYEITCNINKRVPRTFIDP